MEEATSLQNIILVLRPHPYWGLVGAELKRVSAIGKYMAVERSVRIEETERTPSAELQRLATLCEELRPSNLYARYGNKKQFRHEADFWATDNTTVKQHTKQMADQRLANAIREATRLDIPILYAATPEAPLHINDRLLLNDGMTVTPVMKFSRGDNGTTYQLTLRLGEALTVAPSERQMTVLTYEPCLFILDREILSLDDSFSAKLLLPFTKKTTVDIPRHIENDYFRRFILRHVAKAEIQAEGFDICDVDVKPCPCLELGTSIDGKPLLALRFRYGDNIYSPDTPQRGRVTLGEEGGTFRFVRQLRNLALEQSFVSQLQAMGLQPPARGTAVFPSLGDLIEWLQHNGPLLRSAGFDVVQPSEHVYYIGPLNVEQSETWHGDWLQTDVTIVLDDGRLRIPFTDLRDTILRGEQDYMLPTGQRLLIPEEWLQRYHELLLVGTPKNGSFHRHRSQLVTPPTTQLPRLSTPQLTNASTPNTLRATLRPYQQTGFQWLWRNFETGMGCCLSDEMGLGKTLQTIALLLKYKELGKAPKRQQPQAGLLFTDEEMQGRPTSSSSSLPTTFQHPFLTSLVVAPASVVHNWQNELRRFAPSLLVLNYTGDPTQRREKRRALMSWDVVLTTYRTLQNDIAHLSTLNFGIVVFDESQTFKTSSSQVYQAVASINALHRLALSGTPVENNLGELWSLMSIISPNLLGSRKDFQQAFENPIARQLEQERTQLLRRLIGPCFLKRTKEEVLSDLPERQDEVVVCPMTSHQQQLYAEELSRARNEWLDTDATDSHRSIHLLAALQRLRQIANGEGKMQAVFDRLEQLRGTHHKVLIFSEYVSLLEQVADEMLRRDWAHAMLTGQTRQREQVIAHFQQDAACQFFLISLKAGGVGLNLTAADYVMLLDPWWNRSAEEQAIARAHRIGQHHPVFVYRFVSENTLEQQILTLQERKQSLIDSVMPFIGLT